MKIITLMCLGITCAIVTSCQSPQTKNAVDNTDTTVIKQHGTTDTTQAGKMVFIAQSYLQKKFKTEVNQGLIDSTGRKFTLFAYDLNEDGKKEILVGLTGSYFCGSGGCTCLLLDETGKMITQFTVVQYPILIALSKTHGWKDLIIYSGGKNHLIKHTGVKYPSNPSMQPMFQAKPDTGLIKALNFKADTYKW